MFTFHINKESLDNVFLIDVDNTDSCNAFYTVYFIDSKHYDRIDINLTSKTFEALNDFYKENIEDKQIVVKSIIDIISETIQHEYLHKSMGYDINMGIERYNCDRIIERLI